MDNIKKFDDFLDRMQGLLDNAKKQGHIIVRVEDLENTFPELKESGDERIRKKLITFFQRFPYTNLYDASLNAKDVLAWLEKQCEQKSTNKVEPRFKIGDTVTVKPMSCHGKVFKGEPFKIVDIIKDNYVSDDGKTYSISLQDGWELVEQNHTDKVEPKFKIGDWVMYCGKPYQITGLRNDTFTLTSCDGSYFFNNVKSTYKPVFHLWTIQDAKEGDVLVDDEGFIMLVDESRDSKFGYRLSRHCAVLSNGEFTTDNVHTRIDGLHPATKEQRDLLFQKMKEAGYEFDFEKKELRKINNALEECEIEHIEHGKYYYCIKDYYSGGCKRASKGEVVQALRGMSMMALGVKANEYFIPVKCIVNVSPAWSEEDEYTLNETIQHLEELIRIDKAKHLGCDVQYYQRDIDWLKSLKDRVLPKQQWSEKDERERKHCIDFLNHPDLIKATHTIVDNCRIWLESLKPQNTWKPSDEQIDALAWALSLAKNCGEECAFDLRTLQDQLKKLREG